MSWSEGERLYHLLPAIHRIRDGDTGETLRALLSVIESELETLEGDIDGLYDNWFIETCDPWVIPYIGDLVANRPLHEVVQPRRADVAKTISYRRRKATVPMLEELARDVTGWDARIVEFFQMLLWTQNVNHRRFRISSNPLPLRGVPPERQNPDAVDSVGTVPLRHLDLLDRLDDPFDALSHTVDVRPACQLRDRYLIRKIGFELWRLVSYEIPAVTPVPSPHAVDGSTTYGFHISPIGAPFPLFHHARARSITTSRTTELDVGGPIRPLGLHHDLERLRTELVAGAAGESDYVHPQRSLWIVKGHPTDPDQDAAVPPEKIVVMDLTNWHRPPATIRYRTPAGLDADLEVVAGIDPQLGRIVFAAGCEPDDLATNRNALKIEYHYGFGADLGGGPYRRDSADADTVSPAEPTWSATVSVRNPAAADYDDLEVALNAWAGLSAVDRRRAVITIADNATYDVSTSLTLATDEELIVRSADARRPTLRVLDDGIPGGELVVNQAGDDTGDGGGLTLEGLLVCGGLRIDGPLRELKVLHCTVVPGRRLDEDGQPVEPDHPSIAADTANTRLEVIIDHAIVGPLRLPETMPNLTIRDSIVDGLADLDSATPRAALAFDPDTDEPGPPTTLERVTVFGTVHVRQLTLASNAIFTGQVRVMRKQLGCVRFSFVPPGSTTPRRYRCQPDFEIAAELARSLESRTQREIARIEAAGGIANRQAIEAAIRSQIQRQIVSWLAPSFTSCRYGEPSYAQLRRAAPLQIRTGAEDGSEMGVFASLRNPQREANLRQRLNEYLPFGLEPAVLFAT